MGLKHRDLEHTILSRVSIDEYEPKTGESADVVVLGLRVMDQAPAKDLYSFINSSTAEVRDVEVSPNPDLENYFMVFVEIDRKPGCLRDIRDLLADIEHVSGPLKWRASTHLTDDYLDIQKPEFQKYFIEDPADYQTREEFEQGVTEDQESESDQKLAVGNRVRIVDGPLLDLLPEDQGIVMGFDTKGTAELALVSFGDDADDLIPVETEYLELVDTDKSLPEMVQEQESDSVCPAPTQDLELNTKNRDSAIQAEHIKYGPLNVDVPGDYWQELADHWDTDVEAAKASLCENCAAFDISPRMLDCMPGELQDEDGYLGYCWMHHFKCHSARTCRTWAKGGAITDDSVSYDWQERNPVEESVPADLDIIEFLKYSNAQVESLEEGVVTFKQGADTATLKVIGIGDQDTVLADHNLTEQAINHGDSRMKRLNDMLGDAHAVWLGEHIVIYHRNHKHMLVTKPC